VSFVRRIKTFLSLGIVSLSTMTGACLTTFQDHILSGYYTHIHILGLFPPYPPIIPLLFHLRLSISHYSTLENTREENQKYRVYVFVSLRSNIYTHDSYQYNKPKQETAIDRMRERVREKKT
jgi:hypothetical protein